MKAAVVRAPNDLRVEEVPEPLPGDYQVLVKSLACGVCGTDRHILRGTFYRRDYPGILGHEAAGRVVSLGSRVRYLRPGDVVLRTTAVYPCTKLGEYGSLLGGMAEYALAADARAYEEDHPGEVAPFWWRVNQVLPPTIDPLDSGMMITFKETLSWSRRFGVGPDSRVVVLGLGSVGLSFVRVARVIGAERVVAVGRRTAPLSFAAEIGADATVNSSESELVATIKQLIPKGATHVIEAAGSAEYVEAAPALLATGGKVGVYGIAVRQQATIDWSWGGPAPREWSLHFHSPDEPAAHEEAVRLVESGALDLKRFRSHVVPLAEVSRAFQLLDDKVAIKISIDLNGGEKGSK